MSEHTEFRSMSEHLVSLLVIFLHTLPRPTYEIGPSASKLLPISPCWHFLAFSMLHPWDLKAFGSAALLVLMFVAFVGSTTCPFCHYRHYLTPNSGPFLALFLFPTTISPCTSCSLFYIFLHRFKNAYCCRLPAYPTVPNWYFSKQCLPSAHIATDFFLGLNGRGCFLMCIITEDWQPGSSWGRNYAATWFKKFYCTNNFWLSLVAMRIKWLNGTKYIFLYNVITLCWNIVLIR